MYDGCQKTTVFHSCIAFISICLKGCCFSLCSASTPQEPRKRSRKQNLGPRMSCRYVCVCVYVCNVMLCYVCMYVCVYVGMYVAWVGVICLGFRKDPARFPQEKPQAQSK